MSDAAASLLGAALVAIVVGTLVGYHRGYEAGRRAICEAICTGGRPTFDHLCDCPECEEAR